MRIMKKNIFNHVLEYLRKEIILGNYSKGEYLVEVTLAKELNVSRGPIREAIAKLEAENLVEKHSNGRTVVKGFEVKDIQDLYDSRILLENHALTQISLDDLKENENLLFLYIDQMKEAHEKGERDIEIDLAFHGLLVKMTNNNALTQLWLALRDLFRTLIDITSEVTASNQNEIIAQHSRVVVALSDGEVKKAQQLLKVHLEEACNYCCDGIMINKRGEKYVTGKD
ncbi:DNA-binding GntR family transcriptional regulator [Virgibacillus natechei]|uniref:DNA-binding GntR family transcriptional regulator n=1 Tax=Virgibacillus natechei TaxID=1216297 RepID=A0ABS4II84_9BACI|nr:GntR family transcriptional regulator [Virgibacillus natechei]MBP1970675.1 DNA-binding GntR family transcriptional regulator [Virgibacillus natechei]UZD12078.1 GntR family transcriptional regulator [Virgibacillus natechei]